MQVLHGRKGLLTLTILLSIFSTTGFTLNIDGMQPKMMNVWILLTMSINIVNTVNITSAVAILLVEGALKSSRCPHFQLQT